MTIKKYKREPCIRIKKHKKGIVDGELPVREALENLYQLEYIDFFIHAERHSALDAAHIDFLLCKDKKLVSLQVKGNHKALLKHTRRYPLIPVLLVRNSTRRVCLPALEDSILSIFHNEKKSHELVLDERTVITIRSAIECEGFLLFSPFA